ncbi:DUF1837 domain-containing protein [bacterium]|nr:DUF1837 domain-containing protein [bacterium]
MKKLFHRTKSLIHLFSITYTGGSWDKHPYTLDYENDQYREDELVRILIDALPHFALTASELQELKKTDDFGEMYRKAFSRISNALPEKKGDYGELLLFLLLSAFYPAERFVTKVRLRSSLGDQVKGFDCAHFTVEADQIWLWLGEVKFYKSFSGALSDIVDEIQDHCKALYLKNEFSILASNCELNENFPDADKLKSVIDGSTPINQVNITIPALITYDSSTISKHKSRTDKEFIDAMSKEFEKKFQLIDGKKLPHSNNIRVFFLVMPFASVTNIKQKLHTFESLYR